MTTSTEVAPLGVASGKDVIVALDSKMLFADQVDGFMDLVWEERERRLRAWATDGWTQAKIAKEVGRTQKSVSRWMERFDIKPSRPTRQPKTKAKAKPAATATASRHTDYSETEAETETETKPEPKAKTKPTPKAKPKPAPKPHRHVSLTTSGPFSKDVAQLVTLRNDLARTLEALSPEQVWRLDQSTRGPDQVGADVLIELDLAALSLSFTVSYLTARLLRPDQPESWGPMPEWYPKRWHEEGRPA